MASSNHSHHLSTQGGRTPGRWSKLSRSIRRMKRKRQSNGTRSIFRTTHGALAFYLMALSVLVFLSSLRQITQLLPSTLVQDLEEFRIAYQSPYRSNIRVSFERRPLRNARPVYKPRPIKETIRHEHDYDGLKIKNTGGKPREIVKYFTDKNFIILHESEPSESRKSRRHSLRSGSSRSEESSGDVCHEDYTDWYDASRIMNCNTVHELGLTSDPPSTPATYIGKGGYREVYAHHVPVLDHNETLVFKRFREKRDLNHDEVDSMHREAAVMEMFSGSPHINSMYAYCQLTTLAEFIPGGDIKKATVPYLNRKNIKLHDSKDVDPQNNFTASQKLQYALEMAQAIAVLHSKMVVHDDLKPAQYLLNDDGHLVLSDFNRAVKLRWNPKRKEYCPYNAGRRKGDWRTPEEYMGHQDLDETTDIWALGMCFYSLLTGLVPFDDIVDEDIMKAKVKRGETPFIDPRYRERSFAERQLVEIMESCWAFEPKDRPSAQELVDRLQNAIEENERLTNETHNA